MHRRTDGETTDLVAALAELGQAQRSILNAVSRAVIVSTPAGEIVLWNRQAEHLYGWRSEEVQGRSVIDVLVPAQQHDRAWSIRSQTQSAGEWAGDFELLRRDGSSVLVHAESRPLVAVDGHVVALVSLSEDVSLQRSIERTNAQLTEHLRLALEAGRLGTFRWDIATGTTTWDASLEALFGLVPGEFAGTYDAWMDLIHPDDRSAAAQAIDRAVASQSDYEVEHRVVWPDGSIHWLRGFGRVTFDNDGAVNGTIGCAQDVTSQVESEAERQTLILEAMEAADRERINGERLAFLAGINEALATSFDRREVMVNVGRATVPRLGDWCSVYAFGPDDARVPEVETAHVDPAMVAYAKHLQEEFPYDPDAPRGVPQVIRTGKPEFHPSIDEALLDRVGATEPAREVVTELRLSSAITVPLIKWGRVLGALQLVMTDSGRRYTVDDLTLAEVIAARIASTLENVRLSEEQREIATALQASLLPPDLPVMGPLETAARYWANGESVEAGGDFYDVFTLREGSWGIVIGDVCGTGPAAAAVTGLARHTMASSAWHGDDHRGVLQHLNHAMRARGVDTFCTALYGTVVIDDDEVELTVASAGHPLPVLVRADGLVTTVGTHGRLAGPFDHIEPAPASVRLDVGDVVVLYTDGATDVAPPHGLNGEEFRDLVGRAAQRSTTAEEVADAIETALSHILPVKERHDDIAIVVLRHPGQPAS